MIWQLTFWVALATAAVVSFRYFRDLGDITQGIFNVQRKNVLFAIRHENQMIATGVGGTLVAGILHYWQGAGIGWVFVVAACANALMLAFPWLWIHVGLRNQQSHAAYYSLDEAKDWVRPEDSVIVIENGGVARAHPDYHIKRPHIAGTADGLGGENVVMTYCALTHLGLGFKPEIDGRPLDIEVLAQHGNNLIMKDMSTGEPIQQVYGTRECNGRWAQGMEPWPTFRMSFRGFQKAYPNGKVFLNSIVPFRKNPLLWAFDNVVEAVFLWGTIPHHGTAELLFKTMNVQDDRLPGKTLVWGFNVGRDSAAYTEDFIRENGNIVNATVGGQRIVAAYHPEYESIGVYYNDGDGPVTRVEFGGESDQGRLRRVETLKAGAYWFVCINYFPETELNPVHRVGQASQVA